MPIPSTNNSTTNERILVDDLPYVDQEYGDPTLREAVSKRKLINCFMKRAFIKPLWIFLLHVQPLLGCVQDFSSVMSYLRFKNNFILKHSQPSYILFYGLFNLFILTFKHHSQFYITQALALVDEETRRYRPTKNYLEHLPPLELSAFEVEKLKLTKLIKFQ